MTNRRIIIGALLVFGAFGAMYGAADLLAVRIEGTDIKYMTGTVNGQRWIAGVAPLPVWADSLRWVLEDDDAQRVLACNGAPCRYLNNAGIYERVTSAQVVPWSRDWIKLGLTERRFGATTILDPVHNATQQTRTEMVPRERWAAIQWVAR